MSHNFIMDSIVIENPQGPLKVLEDDELLYMQAYLMNINSRISPPFFERKLRKGVAETIEEELEELYSEMFELDAYIKSLLNTNAVLLNNYEEKTREIVEKRLRLSGKHQILKEEIQQTKKDLNEMEALKEKLICRNESLSEQIKKMEVMYLKSSTQYDNLNEEIMTLNDYQDKVYQLREEMSLTVDLINNLKYEYNEYKLITNASKQKHLKKEKKKVMLKNKLVKYEEKLRNLLDKEKNEMSIHMHMSHHLEFLKKTLKNLQELNQRKEGERKSLENMIDQHQEGHEGRIETNSDYNLEKSLFLIGEEEEKKSEFLISDKNCNLQNEFKQINIADDCFIADKHYGLMSNRNTRIYSGNFNQMLNSPSKLMNKRQEPVLVNNSSKISKRKKKEENPDQVYIDTIKFFIKHKLKIFFVCLMIPIVKYNLNNQG